MRDGTSGFWLTDENGQISIGYEDYGVDMFGGGDFERTYRFDKVNSEKFREALAKEYSGTLEEMVEEAFGRNFADWKFFDFCKRYGIRFNTSSWTS